MTIQQLEKDYEERVERYRAQDAKFKANGRTPTNNDVNELNQLVAEANVLKRQIDQAKHDADVIAQVNRLSGDTSSGGRPGRTWGERYVELPEFREWIRAGKHRHSHPWGDVPVLEMSATTLTSSPTSGGALVTPDYLKTIVPLGQRPAVVADLFEAGSTESNTVNFTREKTFTNAADAVAEGLAKPESTLVYEAATTPVCKFAHFIPVTTELLEDGPAMATTIDGQLRRGLELKIDDALLNGTGVSPQLPGLLTRPGLAPDQPRGADTNIDAIKKGISAIFNATQLRVTAVILHPLNLDTIMMAKNAQGNYLVPSREWLFWFWGVDAIASSPVTVAGTAVIGAFSSGGARLFNRSGPTVSATNSHQDWFVKNLVAVLAERRLALATYRENSFGRVTGLN